MADKPHECCFCDERFEDIQSLCDHLPYCTGLPRQWFRGKGFFLSKSNRTARCWCGNWPGWQIEVAKRTSQFARHLERSGGLVAHLLTIGMNLRNRP